jgi:hypothetical protein
LRDVEILERLHVLLKPRAYLQLGSRQPARIEQAACATVLVDPDPILPPDVLAGKPWLKFYAMTRDAFFADEDPARLLDAQRIDLAVIDGAQSLGQLARDLGQIERWSHERTVAAVFSDGGERELLSRYIVLARQHRPDLRVQWVASDPAPCLLVSGFAADRDVRSSITLEAAAANGSIPGDLLQIEPPVALEAALPRHLLESAPVACRFHAGSWEAWTCFEDVVRPRGPRTGDPPRIVFARPLRGAVRIALEIAAGGMEVMRLRCRGEGANGARQRDIFLDVGKPGALHHELDRVTLAVPTGDAGFRLELECALAPNETLHDIAFSIADHWRNELPETAEMTLQVRQAQVWELLEPPACAPFAASRRADDPPPEKGKHGRRDAVIFAWWLPENEAAEQIGQYYLGLLRYHHPDSKFFIGINHGTAAYWPERIAASGLDTTIAFTPPRITVTSDAAGYLAALAEYERCAEEFDLLWFGHTKGGSTAEYDYYLGLRFVEERTFWARRTAVERAFVDPKIGLFAARYNLCPPYPFAKGHPGWEIELDALQRVYREQYAPIGLNAYETFFALRSSIVRRFCDVVGQEFFQLDPREWSGDRWFFEMAFPSIASMQGYEPAIPMDMLGDNDPRDDLQLTYDAKQNHRLALEELERWRQDPYDFEPRILAWDHPAWDRVRGIEKTRVATRVIGSGERA